MKQFGISDFNQMKATRPKSESEKRLLSKSNSSREVYTKSAKTVNNSAQTTTVRKTLKINENLLNVPPSPD